MAYAKFDCFSHMAMLPNFMVPTFFLTILSLLLISASLNLQSNEEGFISVLISNKGLDFAKDILINKAISSIIPIQLPEIEKSVKIPLVGKVHMVLSHITLYDVNVAYSAVRTGETGIVLVASGATANLSMKWSYSYSTWLFEISDNGDASVQVEGMEVGTSIDLNNHKGTLNLSILDCGCHVEDVFISVEGGASWLYQGVVDAFQGKIGSAVESAISRKIREGITKLDSLLQSLPKEVKVNGVASMNVTFVNDPVFSNSSIGFMINGLLSASENGAVSWYYYERIQASVSCKDQDKMVEISLHENVLNSASLVYFNEDYMHWTVDKVFNQSLLNTAEWRYIVPQLYRRYPNDDMILSISVSSPPIIKIAMDDIDATVYLDVTIAVLDAGEVTPVACISAVISASCSPAISSNYLAGNIRLNDFNISLKWSNIGTLHMHLVQTVLLTLLKNVILPVVNLRLTRGFPLPTFYGLMLQNAEIFCTGLRVVICSNAATTGIQLPVYSK